jgi:hypothetical protein
MPRTDIAPLLESVLKAYECPDDVAASLYLARELRAELRRTEERIADALPPLTPADFVRMCNGDHAVRAEVERFRDARWSVVDVSDLPDEGWTILCGSSRFEVREVPRYEARRVGGPGIMEGGQVWDNEGNEHYEADDEQIHMAGLDAGERFTMDDAETMARYLNQNEEPCYIVWDTNAPGDARDGGRYDVFRECGADDYDPTDEGSARNAAEQANVEDYQQNACGWPFAHNYAAQIDEREGEDFAVAGFVVARHEPSGQVYAGIDAGGFDFLQAFWAPLYLRVLLHGRYAIYVPTDAGLRRVVRA